jgi:hypothetical protein
MMTPEEEKLIEQAPQRAFDDMMAKIRKQNLCIIVVTTIIVSLVSAAIQVSMLMSLRHELQHCAEASHAVLL